MNKAFKVVVIFACAMFFLFETAYLSCGVWSYFWSSKEAVLTTFESTVTSTSGGPKGSVTRKTVLVEYEFSANNKVYQGHRFTYPHIASQEKLLNTYRGFKRGEKIEIFHSDLFPSLSVIDKGVHNIHLTFFNLILDIGFLLLAFNFKAIAAKINGLTKASK